MTTPSTSPREARARASAEVLELLRGDLRAVRTATLDVVMAANALEEALLLAMESGLEPGADDTALAAIGLELNGLLNSLRALAALASDWADRVILTDGP